MTITTLMPEARQRYFNNDGTVAAGCFLWTYAAGTTDLKTTFKDADGAEEHTNPIELDVKGEAVIFWEGAYKIDLKAADGTQITGYPVDDIRTDPAGLWSLVATLLTSAGASMVGFIQSGAGAVLRTLQSKSRDVVHVADFGAVGDGVTDDTAAVTAAIVAGKVVVFGDNKDYLISSALPVLSNRKYKGNRARLIAASQSLTAFFNNNAAVITNVDFDDLRFDGGGTFGGSGATAKFSNANVGIYLNNGGSDWRIRNCSFTGMDRAATLTGGDQVSITSNHVLNNGIAGFSIARLTNFIISDNVIDGVLGDDNFPGTTYGKFGDGVYVDACVGGVISNNQIMRCVRIGIVLESSTAAVNKNISISGNSISDLSNSRDTESNCGIWVEGGKSDGSISITGNTVRYVSSWSGFRAFGILCFNGGSVVGNYLYGPGTITTVGYGVQAQFGDTNIVGNLIKGFQAGIVVSGPFVDAFTYNIKSNVIKDNGQYGIYVLGNAAFYDIVSNTIQDNGGFLALPGNGFGGVGVQLFSSGGYTPRANIVSNLFISSADEGDTTGQLYGLILASSPLIYGLKSNTFVFTGTFTTPYPNHTDKPSCIGYALGGVSVSIVRDYIGDHFGNTCSKAPVQNYDTNSFSGNPRYLGVANSIPSAAFPTTPAQIGDYYLNNVLATNGPEKWICTTAGTPGTWEPIGVVGCTRAAHVATTSGATLAALETNVNQVITSLIAAKSMA